MFPQNQNSQYGKTLKINKNNGEYQILSMGHRNPQGIKKIQDDLFISTEHGPRIGDEINLIDTSDIKLIFGQLLHMEFTMIQTPAVNFISKN